MMLMKNDGFLKWMRPLATRGAGVTFAGMAALVGMIFSGSVGAESAVSIPAPAADIAEAQDTPQTAVLAGGCFWGVQAVFQHTKGVLNAVSGYAGGKKETATYKQVSMDNTGHAESVQITFDPKQISYGKLLQIYFSVAHDPTQLNRQYPDVGTQYRSAIFYKDARQKEVAEKYVAQLDNAHVFHGRIVTQISPLNGFYPAEAYHQDYATLHPHTPYIATFDLPKIDNLKRMFPQLYRESPVLVASKDAATVDERK